MKRYEHILSQPTPSQKRDRLRQQITERTGLSEEEQFMLTFELGCQYVEKKHSNNPRMVWTLLTDYYSGFWPFWRQMWATDDACLLELDWLDSEGYTQCKKELLDHSWVDALWLKFRNERLK